MEDKKLYINIKPKLFENDIKTKMSFRGYLALKVIVPDYALPEGKWGIREKTIIREFHLLDIRKNKRESLLEVLQQENIIIRYTNAISFLPSKDHFVSMTADEIIFCLKNLDEKEIRIFLYLLNQYRMRIKYHHKNFCFSYKQLSEEALGRSVSNCGSTAANKVVKRCLQTLQFCKLIRIEESIKSVKNKQIKYKTLVYAGFDIEKSLPQKE